MSETAPHADEARLRALTRGELPRDEAFKLSQHLLDCDECSQRLTRVEAATPPGRTVGRYVVLDEVGRGGMGRVLRAWDPQLERFVAIKRLLDAGKSDAQARLLREAQVMAKVTHPNLVAVYDAGLADQDVYLVMEFVKGSTLAQWLAEAPRTWRETLRLFLQAGRGLAAAHAASLVHRDFKPSNVLVQDGVAKVTDFGLALASSDVLPAMVTSPDAPPSTGGASARVTRAGVNAGTPEYMAPEQFRGSFDARSDQFSFARALEQALVGKRPPRWVVDALRRALSPGPDQRYPSMEPLLEALSPEARARRALVLQVVVAAVLVLGGAVAFTASRRIDCARAEFPMTAAWTPQVRSGVAQALSAVPEASSQHVLSAFDGWAQRWRSRSRESCEATTAGSQSERVELLKRLCLERRLAFFTTVLAQAPSVGVEALTRVAEELPPVDCSDDELVATGAADESEELRTRLQPVRLELGRIDALLAAGQRQAAYALAEPTLAQARSIGFGPVVAETALLVGQSLRERDLEGARAKLRESYALIASSRAVNSWPAHVGSRAALDLLDTYRGDATAFDALRPVAEAAIARAGQDDEWNASLAMTLGRSLLARGEAKGAVVWLRQSYELRLKMSGPDHVRTQLARSNLAAALEAAGENDEAVLHYEALVEMARRLYGEKSAQFARTLGELGASEVVAVKYVSARDHLNRARSLFAALGLPEADEPSLLDNLASLAELSGDFAAAKPLRERVLAQVQEPALRAKYQALMSRVLLETGDLEGARRQASEARAALSAINPHHFDLLVALTTLGRLTPGEEGKRLLETALALPEARDPEYRGDALQALASHCSGAERDAWNKKALASYREGMVQFRVEQLERP